MFTRPCAARAAVRHGEKAWVSTGHLSPVPHPGRFDPWPGV